MKPSPRVRVIRFALILLSLTVSAGSVYSAPAVAPTPENYFEVSGTVIYVNAAVPPKHISDVSVVGTGSPMVQTTTYGGYYTLTGFGWGSYTISLSKTNGVNGINSHDAARIVEHVIGRRHFTNDSQLFIADVTGNDIVSSTDAAKIAQWVVGLPFSPPNFTGKWRFFLPPGPTFPVAQRHGRRLRRPVDRRNHRQLEQLCREARRSRGISSDSIVVDLPSFQTADREIVIPVMVRGAANKEIISFEFDLRYDPSVIQPVSMPADVRGTASNGLSVVANPYEPGLLRVAAYGAFPIDHDGTLVNLRFVPVGAQSNTSLTFDRIMFNEGNLETYVTNGEVSLSNFSAID